MSFSQLTPVVVGNEPDAPVGVGSAVLPARSGEPGGGGGGGAALCSVRCDAQGEEESAERLNTSLHPSTG